MAVSRVNARKMGHVGIEPTHISQLGTAPFGTVDPPDRAGVQVWIEIPRITMAHDIAGILIVIIMDGISRKMAIADFGRAFLIPIVLEIVRREPLPVGQS